jgi:threonyl-tRNA synthetase
MVTLFLPDGSSQQFEGDSIPVAEVVRALGERWVREAVAAEFDGRILDLHQSIRGQGSFKVLREADPRSLDVLRHSASHLLAHAVLDLYPEAKFAIGPPIQDGFYYDFDVEKPFTPEDLVKIESTMHELIKTLLPIEREIWPKQKALEYFKSRNETYKVELIEELPDGEISIYRMGGFVDLCAGPHLDSTRRLKHFKLLSTAGAYWRGDSKRPMLQRIYATAFFKKKDLDEHLLRLAEAEKRDHRKLGKQLDLFDVKEEAGGGLVFWHPKGAILREKVEGYLKEQYRLKGYELVYTPHIARAELWQTSGHFDYYRDNMYTLKVEDQDYVLKPMNCPGHILIYQRKIYSYKELPVRFAEMGTVYRRELSGTLHGLLRVRGFTQDDAHIFCRPDQIDEEVDATLDFALEVLEAFGFKEYKIELSIRDPHNIQKYAGEPEEWDMAENALEKAILRKDLPYKRMEGEAVFYGPKIDIKVIDAIGRAWQLSTIQFDFNLAKRTGTGSASRSSWSIGPC